MTLYVDSEWTGWDGTTRVKLGDGSSGFRTNTTTSTATATGRKPPSTAGTK